MKKEIIGSILSICALISLVFGLHFWMEGRYALAQQVEQIRQRLDYKILSDQYLAIKQRIWTIEDRCGVAPQDITVQEEMRKLKEEEMLMKTRLQEMEKQK